MARPSVFWLWYASKTANSVPLDERKYPSTIFGSRRIPKPDWVCRSPSGGLHTDPRIGAIDLHVAARPTRRVELNWSKDYAVDIVSVSWLDLIADIIDPERIFTGSLYMDGVELSEWKTLHGVHQPPLLSRRMTAIACPNCGSISTWPRPKAFFNDAGIGDEKVIVNSSGLFVREDIALARNLRRPNGTYLPSRVGWKPRDPAASEGDFAFLT